MKITYIVGIAKYHALVNRCAADYLRLEISAASFPAILRRSVD